MSEGALGNEVTAFSSTTAKEQEARGFGADHFAVTGNRDRLRPLDFDFDLLLCTAHGGVDWQVTDVNDAIRRLKEGKVRYRVVLNHASSTGHLSDAIGPGTEGLGTPGT